MSNSDLRRAWKEQQATKQDVTNAIPALMGNGHSVVQVPNQPGYVYIRLGQGDLGQAYNNRCPLTDNLAIYVGYDPVLDPDRRIFQVLSVRMADYAGAGGTPTPNVPPHHLTHEYGGGDDVYISWRRLMGFRVGRPSGFQVTVDEGVIIRAGAWLSVAAQTLDLTALKPGGALGCYVLIVLNAAGAATATAGASVGIGTLDISDCPIPGASQIPLAAVRLYGAQTSIGDTPTAPDIVDLRFPQAMSTGDVHLEDLADYARGHIIRGGAADWESYHAANAGFIVQGDGTDVKSLQFDWDTFSAGAGADMVHDHTSNAEGGTLSGVIPERFLAAYNYEIGNTHKYRIAIASGTDERSISVGTEPTIDVGAGGTWEDDHVKDPCLIDVDGVLWLFYSGYDGAIFQIGVARSYDGGTTWTKYAGNPILTQTQAWEGTQVLWPRVLYDLRETDANRRWKMWYAGNNYLSIGYAYSADGLSWTKYGSNPVLAPSGGVNWDGENVLPGAVVRLGNTFYLFYGGQYAAAGATWQTGYLTFTNPESAYSRATSPILVSDGKTTNVSSNVGIGDTSIAVVDSTIFPVGAPVWLYDATNHYLSTVANRPDSTHVVLTDTAPVAIASATGKMRSAAYNSVFVLSALYDKGWRFGFTAFQIDGGLGEIRELSMLAYSDDLSAIRIDYGAGLLIPITAAESINTYVSRENPCLLPLWRTDDRYTSSPDMIFDDAEGDPVDVDTTAAADGTSDHPARRDHRHQLGSVNLNDLADVDTTGTAAGDILYNNAGTWEDYPLGVGSKVTADSGKIRFGSFAGGNYLEIDTTSGNLRLVGDATAWDDLRIAASVVKPGATAPAYKAFGPSGGLYALMFEAGHHDEAHFEVQMPHNWKEGSKIYPHVHWTPTTADAGNVVWELEYAWANINGTFGAPSNMASDATAAGGTAWVHKLTMLKAAGNAYIDGAGKTMSSMLVCRLHRNSNAGSDTLNKDVAMLDVDFHYEIDSFGSDEEYVKDARKLLLLETSDYLLLETGDKLIEE